jgi:hypothetical protein
LSSNKGFAATSRGRFPKLGVSFSFFFSFRFSSVTFEISLEETRRHLARVRESRPAPVGNGRGEGDTQIQNVGSPGAPQPRGLGVGAPGRVRPADLQQADAPRAAVRDVRRRPEQPHGLPPRPRLRVLLAVPRKDGASHDPARGARQGEDWWEKNAGFFVFL